MKFLDKHSKIILILIFLIGVIVYGFLASKMTSTLYLYNDEELYMHMARSFFFEGHFSKNYELLNYKCVIYSMIISLAYIFYTPENILFIMRMIGVILMCSSVFPVYLLSRDVLKNKAYALGISFMTILLSDFISTLFLIQEVVCYPLFLWITYLVYLKFTKEKNNFREILIIFLLALIFFVKSYAISFAAAYFFVLLLAVLKEKRYSDIKWVILKGFLCLVFIAIGILLIYTINGFKNGTNHYTTQINSIFPITEVEIKALFYGIFYYAVFFMFCAGFLPILIPIFKIKQYEIEDRRLIMFLTACSIITIIESAAIVFVPEERGKLFPDKVCFRYLAPLIMPYIIMFFKCKKENLKIDGKMISVFAIAFVYLIWYYIGQGVRLTEIDAPMLFAIQKIHQGRPENFNAYFILITFFLTACITLLNKLEVIKDLKTIYIEIFITTCVILFGINCYLNVNNTSKRIYQGEILKNEFVKLANYTDRDYDVVYVMDYLTPIRLFYGYTKSDYSLLNTKYEINIDISGKKIMLISPTIKHINVEGADSVDIGTPNISVYVSDKKYDKLHVDYK